MWFDADERQSGTQGYLPPRAKWLAGSQNGCLSYGCASLPPSGHLPKVHSPCSFFSRILTAEMSKGWNSSGHERQSKITYLQLYFKVIYRLAPLNYLSSENPEKAKHIVESSWTLFKQRWISSLKICDYEQITVSLRSSTSSFKTEEK